MKALVVPASLIFLSFSAFAMQEATASFEQLSAAAASAREANDLHKATELYRQALRLNPQWEEGWWALGSIFYDANQYPDAIAALKKLIDLNPRAAPALGLLGLSEFEAGDYSASLGHISKSLELGLPHQDQMEGVLRYHEALLLAHGRQYDDALRKYAWFVQKGVQHDVMMTSLGLAALHSGQFPDTVTPEQRALYLNAGKASYLSMTGAAREAQEALRQLVQQYPKAPGLHLLYGTILVPIDAEAAAGEMRHELEVDPGNGEASATLAWLLLEDDNLPEAVPFAERAFHLTPGFPLAQYAYGRALAEQGKVKEGIEHLEIAAKQAPGNLIFHIALAAAYAKAGRPEEARRERSLALQLAEGERAAPHS